MRLTETFRFALQAVLAHRMRSLLTTLGILIGIAAVILTVGLGQGAQQQVASQINALGTNLLVITPGSSTTGIVRGGLGSASTLTLTDARALAALDHVGLADRADHRPSELSGGQQQRVAVARALVTEPALLLADEPTGNLDSTSTRDVLGLLDELSVAGSTIVLITHEAEVAQAAGRVVHIRDGLLEEQSAVTG